MIDNIGVAESVVAWELVFAGREIMNVASATTVVA